MRSLPTQARWAAVLGCVIALAPACGSDGDSGGATADDTTATNDARDTNLQPADIQFETTPPADTGGSDSGGPDIVFTDTGGADTGDVSADTGPSCGVLGVGCVESDDCCSGWCLQGAVGSQCTRTCIESCPEGWECRLLSNVGPDPVSLCVDVTLALCQPCRTDADCNDVSVNAPNRCLDYGAEGSFCGLNCSDAAGFDCPDGYTCETDASAASDAQQQCRKDDGLCDCNDASIILGRSTDCSIVNDDGVCPGERLCAANGLTFCQGQAASAETCDGVDEDCDGFTDEDVPSEPCQSTNDFGTCDGMTTCPAAGAPGCDARVPAAETCNGKNDDCDDETDEDTDATCFPYTCGGVAGCKTTCATQGDCGAGTFCDVGDVDGDNNANECLPQLDGGDACTTGNHFECEPGFCNGGYCCGVADGECCGSILDCQHLSAERTCTLATAAGCVGERVDGTCDPETDTCKQTTVSDPSACAGDICTNGACNDGFHTEPQRCNGQGACSLGGDVEDCTDSNVCTLDSCDPVAGCVNAPIDGNTAETCYTFEPTFQAGIGECRAGKVACSNGSVVTCADQQGPKAEICNGRDDDCDSFTDEDADECFPYTCKGQLNCATSCNLHTECADGYFCDFLDLDGDNNQNECLPSVGLGSPCNATQECGTGQFCNNGYCCGSATGDCCGSNIDCAHLAGTPQCLSIASCQGERVNAFCDVNSVCQAQTVDDPSACAGLQCQGGSCNGLLASGGKACDGQGFCATPLGTTNCNGTNDIACSYSCEGDGQCVGELDAAVAFLCFVLGDPGDFICECYPD